MFEVLLPRNVIISLKFEGSLAKNGLKIERESIRMAKRPNSRLKRYIWSGEYFNNDSDWLGIWNYCDFDYHFNR